MSDPIRLSEALTDTDFGGLRLAAIVYATMGVPIVPLLPGTKRPAVDAWQQRATDDVDIVDRYWRDHPHANIGALCGQVFDVLDFDLKVLTDETVVKDGRPAWKQLHAAGLLAGSIGAAKTRHGGLHLFYPPSGRGKGVIRGAHVDYQAGTPDRASAGYVVLPPSIVPADTGVAGPGTYAWMDGQVLDLTRPGRVFDLDAAKRLLEPAPERPRLTLVPTAGGGDVERRLAGIERTILELQEGERNRGCYWAALRALEAGVDPERVRPAMLQTGLPAWEIDQVIASARRTGGAP